MGEAWTWVKATPRERAEFVRQHRHDSSFTQDKLCELFDLTHDGLRQIMNGADWRPDYKRAPIPPPQAD